ncbi:MAG: thrombospondin type 3 repeat-containing protein [Bradymonadia bacterium]
MFNLNSGSSGRAWRVALMLVGGFAASAPMTVSAEHQCVVQVDGTVKCWGLNNYGQLGQGDSHNRGTESPEMYDALLDINLGTGRTSTQLEANLNSTCAILDDGGVKCWGYNGYGQLGHGNTTQRGDGSNETGDNLPYTDLGTDGQGNDLDATDLAMGDRHVCAVLNNGGVKCWGNNGSGRLGQGNTTQRGDGANEMGDNLAYTALGTGYTATQIDAFTTHTCAVLNTGELKCWGYNNYGQLGQGDTSARGTQQPEMFGALGDINLGTGRTATHVAQGNTHACAILDDGTLKCWGYNGYGQLGQNNTTQLGDGANETGDNLPTVDLGTGRSATQVTLADRHSCAILDDGSVKCWGYNGHGQLGQGNTTQRGDGANEMGDNLTTVDLGTGRTAAQIDANYYHTCALLDDGTVKCWGYNSNGQLGQGDTRNRGTQAPEMNSALGDIDLGSGTSVVSLEAGANYSCAILDDNSLKCWGYNGYGNLGQGNTTQRGDGANEMGDNLAVTDLGTGRTATDVGAGLYHACARLDDGSVKCWGYNNYGQLGQGNTTQRGDGANEMGDNLVAVDLGTGRTATAVDAFSSTSCAVLDDGSVKCWGYNGYGQLGQEDTLSRGNQQPEMYDALLDVDLGTGRTVSKVEGGEAFSCAVLDDGSVKCWGYNGYGNLGQGNTTQRGDGANEMGDNLAVTDLGTGRTATDVGLGRYHACALLDDGSVKCWGYNGYGQLGQGNTTQRGDGANEMGDNLVAVDLGTGRTATAVDAMGDFSCALLDDGSVKCWGYNGYGNLGQEDTLSRGTQQPEMYGALDDVNLGTGRTVQHAAVGNRHNCVILDDDTVKCWGYNGYGNLGQGNTSARGDSATEMGDNLAVTDLGTGRTAQQLAAGEDHACALLDDNSIKCWGRNNYGQLGQGNTTQRGDGANEMGDNLAAVDLGVGRTATAIDARGGQTCAILDTGDMKCWGYNGYGQLGQGDTNARGNTLPERFGFIDDVDVGTGRTLQQVETSGQHICALLDDGQVKCWGYNAQGQLGLNTTGNRGDSVSELGDNLAYAILGNDPQGSPWTATDIGAGYRHSCALLSNGEVKCWGHNNYGQLGIGNTTQTGDNANEMGDNLATVDLGTGRTATDIDVRFSTTCATLDTGDMKCWGYNGYGQLGQGDTNSRGTQPEEMFDSLEDINVGTGRTFDWIETGGYFTCGLLDNDLLKCWGRNNRGQLAQGNSTTRGDGTNEMGDNLAYASLGTGRTVQSVGTGLQHACALLDNGQVKCWGYNGHGNLGLGNTTYIGDAVSEIGDNMQAVDLGTGRTATQLWVGPYHSCARLNTGETKCWGLNNYGQLGYGDTAYRGDGGNEMGDNLPAVDVGTGRTIVEMALGQQHSCARLDNGTVKCWGRNNFGNLGQGNTTTRGDGANEMGDNLAITNLGTGRTATHIEAGYYHTCAILDNGDTKCWGYNNQGQLGYGNTTSLGTNAGHMGDGLAAVDLGTGLTAVSLGAFGSHTCAVLSDATVKCWGENNNGELGIGTTDNRGDAANEMGDNLPRARIPADTAVVQVSGGYNQTCARYADGTGKCWGYNGYGLLGYEDTVQRGDISYAVGDELPSIDLGTGRTVAQSSVGYHHVCALLDDNSIKCWGRNDLGQLGQGNNTQRGDGANEMGDNLAAVDLGTDNGTPFVVTKLVSGHYHNCALFNDGRAKCWGYNNSGQLGIESTSTRGTSATHMGDNLAFVNVGAGRTITDIDAGGNHTCATLDDNTVKCWGENNNGELNLGSSDNRGDGANEMGDNLLTADIIYDRPLAGVIAGENHSCAIFNDGNMQCWGYNGHGQLLRGDTTQIGDLGYAIADDLRPILLGTGRTVSAVSMGTHHTCALLDDNTVKCWGRNDLGQLGQGNNTQRGDGINEMGDNLAAVDLGTDGGVPFVISQLVSGDHHNCVRFNDGRVKCWGYNVYGQLGIENNSNRGTSATHMGDNLAFVDLGTGRTATHIEAGHNHTCATLDDNSVKCWGYNNGGQLGLGDTANRGDNADEMGDDLAPAKILSIGRAPAYTFSGATHTCVAYDDGNVKCWGSNGSGRLGYGDSLSRGDATGGAGDDLDGIALGTGRTAVQLSVGYHHVCALLDDNSVKCWGRNDLGQLGQGSNTQRGDGINEMGDNLAAVDLGTDGGNPLVVSQLISGAHHNCVRFNDGRVKCWGYNVYGQLGIENNSNRGTSATHMGDNLAFVDLGTGRTATHIEAGYHHTCATLDDETVKCWGYNNGGQLGRGDTHNRGDNASEMGDDLETVKLFFHRPPVATAGGNTHSCMVFNDGNIKCWGSNSNGRLGYGDTLSRGDNTGGLSDDLEPIDLGTGITATDVAVGYYHACALLADNQVKCWGYNAYGQLGFGGTAQTGDSLNEMGDNLGHALLGTDNGNPLQVSQLVSGNHHMCALFGGTAAGQVKCWGYNGHGQLGYGNTNHRGDGGVGELGDNLPFVDLGTGRSATFLTAGANHTCAVLDNARVKCWGYNGNGQLGLLDTVSRGDGADEMGDNLEYAKIPTSRPVVALSAGDNHTCAIYDNGTSKCWGSNSNGRLGYGDTLSRGDNSGGLGDDLDPVALGTNAQGDPLLATQVAAGYTHSCALLDNGRVKCWGYNGYGNLGTGNTTQYGDSANEMGDNLPFVDLGTDNQGDPLLATKVTAGTYFSCALLENNTAKCWGYNGHGQMAQGDTNHRGDAGASELGDNLPAINFGTGLYPVDIEAYYYHACATLNDDTVKCWGYNAHGQLGLLETNSRGDIVQEIGDGMERPKIIFDRDVVQVIPGYLSTCVRFDDGNVKCWGNNGNGQLLQGDTLSRGDNSGGLGDDLEPIDLGFNSQGQRHTVSQVTTGYLFTCALLDDGNVKCWGYNGNGQLGLGHTSTRGNSQNQMGDNLPYVDLGTGRTATRIEAGYYHVCAQLDNDEVKCWGHNSSGRLGQGNTTQRGDGANEMGDNLAAVSYGDGLQSKAVRIGSYHGCSIVEDNEGTTTGVKCWGYNAHGQLGVLATDHRGDAADEMGDDLEYAKIPMDREVVDLALGEYHSCVRLADGNVKCWGYNGNGQLGYGDTRSRGDTSGGIGRDLPTVDLGDGVVVVSVAQGYRHTCALTEEGLVKCWGYNGNGQLGQGHSSNRGNSRSHMGDNLPYVDLGTDRTAISITAGYSHTCALLDNNRVKCWGYNGHGNLGQGNTTQRGDGSNEMGDNLAYTDLGDGFAATAISAGDYHTCAILNDGAVKCWGYNGNGSLGLGNTAYRGDGANEMGNNLPAVDLGTGRTAQFISSGGYHTCAVLDDNSVKCWGYNGHGNLGQGNTTQRGDGSNEMGDALLVTDLGPNRRALAISAGTYHTCVILDSGDTKCWGYNGYGQLGTGNTSYYGDSANEMGDNLPAVNLGAGRTAQSVMAHVNHSCAALDDNSVKCWGRNNYGQLGQGSTQQIDNSVEFGDNLVAVDLGLDTIDPRNALNNGNPVPCDDTDEDGICDGGDNCPLVANLDQADRDFDGIGNVCDVCPDDALNDGDNDGHCGSVDNCPVIANADQANADGDAFGDVCDACTFDADNDIDADGICGDVDNCPTLSNPDQRDDDGNGLGDACVATDAEIGPDTNIHPSVIISSGCVIGNAVQIGANTLLKPNCRLDSNVVVGADVVIGISTHLHAYASVGDGSNIGDGAEIGQFSHFGANTLVAADVAIGRRVTVGDNAQIAGTMGNSIGIGDDFILGAGSDWQNNMTAGDRVTIGANSVIESNTRIGNDVVIGDEGFAGDYTTIESDVTFGVRAYLADGTEIGNRVVTGDDFESRGFVRDDITAGDNVFIGVQGTVSPGAQLADNSSVSNYATVGPDAVLAADVRVYDRAVVGARVNLGANTVVLFNAQIGDDFTMGSDGIIDDGSIVGDNCTFGTNSRVWPYVTIGDNGNFGSGVIIGLNAEVGVDALFENNVTVWAETVIGDRVILRQGSEVRYQATVASDAEVGANQIVER